MNGETQVRPTLEEVAETIVWEVTRGEENGPLGLNQVTNREVWLSAAKAVDELYREREAE